MNVGGEVRSAMSPSAEQGSQATVGPRTRALTTGTRLASLFAFAVSGLALVGCAADGASDPDDQELGAEGESVAETTESALWSLPRCGSLRCPSGFDYSRNPARRNADGSYSCVASELCRRGYLRWGSRSCSLAPASGCVSH